MNDVYAFIEAEKTTHPVALLCRLLKVARSSFYAWMAGAQARAARRAAGPPTTSWPTRSPSFTSPPGAPTGCRASMPNCAGWTGGSTASEWSGSCVSATSPGSPDAGAGR